MDTNASKLYLEQLKQLEKACFKGSIDFHFWSWRPEQKFTDRIKVKTSKHLIYEKINNDKKINNDELRLILLDKIGMAYGGSTLRKDRILNSILI